MGRGLYVRPVHQPQTDTRYVGIRHLDERESSLTAAEKSKMSKWDCDAWIEVLWRNNCHDLS